MKKPPLLKVILVYHSTNLRHVIQHELALQKAFEYLQPDRSTSDLDEVPDVWQRVSVKTITQEAEWLAEEQEDQGTAPTLYVVIVTEQLVNDPPMRAALDLIASFISETSKNVNSDLLIYSLSDIALSDLPPVFAKKQVKPNAALGENRIAPHKLGLLALHRARLLLGETRESDKLKMFISHAKLDGIFFAQSLKQSIESIPELKAWYDAEDLTSGSDFLAEITAASGSCLFIAVRTNAYEQRKICREEFMTAMLHGVPIVVVDALMQPISDASALPFSSVPNVRIPDGNTYRVLLVALREHLKLLLMRASAVEKSGAVSNFRVWPRLPSPAACKCAWPGVNPTIHFWLIPRALCYDAEFLEMRDWLTSLNSGIVMDHLETFRPAPLIS